MRGKQSGYLLLPVAVAIALIGVIAFLISSESAIEVEFAAGELDTARAEYVAQAGLQHALRHHAQQGCGPYTDLTAYPFGSDQYDTKLSHNLGSTSGLTLAVDQDTWIRDIQPTSNHGSEIKLDIRSEGGVIDRALVRYDLSSIPVNAAILSATAWFYVYKDHPQGPVDIHRITADWAEADATWDSMSANFDSAVLTSIPAQPVAGNWVAVNLTSQVQAWANGEPNYGIMLGSTSEGVQAQYRSRESTNPPILEVVVGTPPSSPAKLKSTSFLAGGGSTLIKREIGLVQHPAGHLQLQPGDADGKDAWLSEDKTTWNYGGFNLLRVREPGGDWRSVIEFNLGRLPYGASVLSATLELYRINGFGNDPGPVNFHAVTQSWVEGTNNGGTGAGVTWDYRDTSALPWNTPGGDYDPVPGASVVLDASVDTWFSIDVTSLVRDWSNGTRPNYGMIMVAGDPVVRAEFSSSEDANPALRPKLSVTYSCACGQICAAPQGGGDLLMVVINPTVLVAEDQKARDLFESWGYTVSVISESANQSTYDAAVAANDVVFISETVNSNSVGTKLANAPIGVVSQDGDYNPDLGLASGSAHPVGATLNISDTDHFITRPFSPGDLNIYSASMEQLSASGILGAGQQELGDIAGVASLIALDKGAAMEGGGNAAGRRVMLPLGTRYRFNWDHLNANGRLLVHRALQWGLGADDTSLGNVLLVVVDPGLLTAQEAAKKALIEGWGFTVNLIDESDSQANFDAAIAANDVAYIPQEITSSNLGTKLRDAAIGVVNEEGEQVDELGFANDKIFKSRHEIDVIDNTHYITQPFAPGLLAFALSDQSVHMLAGGIAPGLQTLGRSFNTGSLWNPSLATLDPGDELSGGGPAAGRRVQLPWGGGTLDINQLNDDGRTIMQRALEWGAGITPPPPVQQLLFVVPSPGSLDPADAAKQALFESWGYTVNQIDDDAPLADYQAAIGANSVAYVSATAVAASVGSKLFKASIGVVNANSGLHDDFGFSTVRYITSTNAPLNTVASHYITQPFGGGQVTLYTSDQTSGGAVGTLAADLDQIGTWSSGGLSSLGGLVTLDAGAMTSIGEVASGRRAQMP